MVFAMTRIKEKLDWLEGLSNLDKLSEADKSFLEFVKVFKKSISKEDCESGDCDEVVCPECAGKLSTMFATTPLKVRCNDCDKEYILKELLVD
jgi:hypothetical protein